jgi:ribonuclease HI
MEERECTRALSPGKTAAISRAASPRVLPRSTIGTRSTTRNTAAPATHGTAQSVIGSSHRNGISCSIWRVGSTKKRGRRGAFVLVGGSPFDTCCLPCFAYFTRLSRYECEECGRKMTSLSSLTQHLEATGHARREARLVNVMIRDAQQSGMLMLTNGAMPRLYHECTLYFDGSARPNPCVVGGAGWNLQDHNGRSIVTAGEPVYGAGGYDRVTNNHAEYIGLIRGLSAAVDEGVKRLKVRGDSELVINQMNGVYHCNEKLRPLRDHARRLVAQFQTCEFEWIPREENSIADAWANRYAVYG